MTEPKRCCNPFQRANHSKYKRCNKLDEITSHLHRRYNLPVGKYICEPCRFYAWRMTSHKYKHKKRPERLECPQYWPKMTMERNYKRTMQAKPETMQQAARFVKHGVPHQQLSRESRINLFDKILPPLIEAKLVEYLMKAANINFNLTTKQVRKMAHEIAEERNVQMPTSWTETGMAGGDWCGSFIHRHRALKELLVTNRVLLSKSYNYGQTEIDMFYNKLESLVKKYKFKSGNIWSLHECGVSLMNVPDRVTVRGYGFSKTPLSLVTIAVAVCADGDKVPPFFSRPTELDEEPSKLSNWMDQTRFLEYLQHFVSYSRCNKKEPCLLVIDNQSYLSIRAMDYAEKHGLVLQSFPHYSSHKLTPLLERNLHQHFSNKINDICRQWFTRNRDRPMAEEDIERMVTKNYNFIFFNNMIKTAFKNSGIYPLRKLVLTGLKSEEVNQLAQDWDTDTESVVEIGDEIKEEEDEDEMSFIDEMDEINDEERKLLLTKDFEKDKTREVDGKRSDNSHWQQQDEVVVKVEDEVTEINRPDDSDRFDYENNTTGAWSQDENCGDDTPTGGEEESNEPVVNLEIGGRGEEVVVPSLRMLQQRSPVASASTPAMSNMYPQQYCLRWKYHHSNLQTMFSQLLERQAYCDVTLACEGKTLRAHKVVLSACSTYFDTILSQYEEKDPIVIMRDVKFSDIKVLVEFMYKGEINIDHSRLSSLLKTAEDLHIKGLAEVSWRSDSAQNDLANSGHSPGAAPPGVEAVLREGDSDDAPPPKQRRRGRPPLDDPPSAHDVFTPKITYITGNVGSEGTISAGQEQGRSFTLWKPPGVLVVKPTLARPFEYDKHSNQKEEMMSEGGDHESWGDDDLMIAENSENPIPGLSAYREDVVDQDNKKLVANNPLNTNANNLSIPEQFRDVIKMNDYLTTGRRQEFWEEPFTRRVMDAIKSKELEMKTAAEILGVSYGTLYGRYRDSYGCLKHPYRVRDFWTEPGPAEVLAKLRRKEITLFRAAEFLNVTVHTLATYLSTLQGPDRISLTGDLGTGANIDGSSNDTDNNESMNDLIQKINANATAITPTTSTPIKREGGGYIEVPNLMQKPAAVVLENNPDITIVKTEGPPTQTAVQLATRKRDYSKLVSSNAENNNAKLMSGGALSEQQVASSGAQSVMTAALASSGAAKLDALSLNNDNGKP